MTILLDSRHDIDHNEMIKAKDAAIKQHGESDVKEHIEIVHLLIDALATANQDATIDFSHDDVMRRYIDEIYNKYPRVFGYEKTYCWKTTEDREEFLAALKNQFDIVEPSDKTDRKPTPLETFVTHVVVPEQEETRHDAELAINAFAQEVAVADAGVQDNGVNKEQQVDLETLIPPEPVDETKPPTYKDSNLGLAFIAMQTKAFDLTEARIHKLVDQLAELNAINKDLSDLLNGLTMNKESGKADFSKDDEMQSIIDRLFEVNPKIFGNQKTYFFQDGKQIDMVLAAIDAEIKAKVAEVNQVTMFINVRFDERVQYSENARKVLEMLIRHCESIISKYHKT